MPLLHNSLGHSMDLNTTNLLAEFSKEFEVEDLPEDDRFELLASYITAKRHYTETFSPSDVVIGNDIQGIDAVADTLRIDQQFRRRTA